MSPSMGFDDGTLVLKAFRFGIYCREPNLVIGYSCAVLSDKMLSDRMQWGRQKIATIAFLIK